VCHDALRLPRSFDLPRSEGFKRTCRRCCTIAHRNRGTRLTRLAKEDADAAVMQFLWSDRLCGECEATFATAEVVELMSPDSVVRPSASSPRRRERPPRTTPRPFSRPAPARLPPGSRPAPARPGSGSVRLLPCSVRLLPCSAPTLLQPSPCLRLRCLWPGCFPDPAASAIRPSPARLGLRDTRPAADQMGQVPADATGHPRPPDHTPPGIVRRTAPFA
jgi:hypothetical protein